MDSAAVLPAPLDRALWRNSHGEFAFHRQHIGGNPLDIEAKELILYGIDIRFQHPIQIDLRRRTSKITNQIPDQRCNIEIRKPPRGTPLSSVTWSSSNGYAVNVTGEPPPSVDVTSSVAMARRCVEILAWLNSSRMILPSRFQTLRTADRPVRFDGIALFHQQ